MLPVRLGLRSSSRLASRAPFRNSFTRLPQPQRRWATYQRFPGKGGGQRTNAGGYQYSNFGPFARAQYIWRNHRTAILVVGAGGGTFYVINLEEVPITHRRRFNIISPEQEKSMMAGGAYEQMLDQFRGKILPANHPYSELVARVVERLLPATGGLAGEDWRVHVIDDKDMVNAFVMPGGKVFVFTGILPICQDENGLAAVLGHEIAHNVAHHSAERLSRSIPIMVGAFLGSLLFDVSGGLSNQIASLFLELPNSRTQENEADHIGLLMMAQSCYDPNRVPDLWKRMAQAEKYSPPQFLSTHPASASRAETIRTWLPEANAKFQESECASTSRYSQQFAKTFEKQQTPRGIPRSVIQSKDDDDWF